jgi:hypothetical protein
MAASPPLPFSQRLLALADRVAVSRVPGAAAGDTHDWLPLRRDWAAAHRQTVSDERWWVGYVQGTGLDPRLAGCMVQIVAVDRAVAGAGPWPVEVPDDGRQMAGVRLRLQRLDDNGFVEARWDGGKRVRLSLRLGGRATLRSHARQGDSDAWAIRLYRLIEVVRDWTPSSYQA